jgi:hypothetical protein
LLFGAREAAAVGQKNSVVLVATVACGPHQPKKAGAIGPKNVRGFAGRTGESILISMQGFQVRLTNFATLTASEITTCSRICSRRSTKSGYATVATPDSERLLAECRAADTTVHEVAQGLLDALMLVIIQAAPDMASAERDIGNITECMRDNIRRRASVRCPWAGKASIRASIRKLRG